MDEVTEKLKIIKILEGPDSGIKRVRNQSKAEKSECQASLFSLPFRC
jgi:hypothetical protein